MAYWPARGRYSGCRDRESGQAGAQHALRAGLEGSERVTGIEPALSAWEADVLPLNYTRAQPAGGGHCSRQRPTTPVSVAQTSYRNRRGVGDWLRGQSILAQSTLAVMSARTRDGISGWLNACFMTRGYGPAGRPSRTCGPADASRAQRLAASRIRHERKDAAAPATATARSCCCSCRRPQAAGGRRREPRRGGSLGVAAGNGRAGKGRVVVPAPVTRRGGPQPGESMRASGFGGFRAAERGAAIALR
jgi:hypothetical protein